MKYLIFIFTLLSIISCSTTTGDRISQLQRSPGTKMDDGIISRAIVKSIKNQKLDKTNNISVSTYNAVVLFTGEVADENTKQKITKIAQDVYQVRKVIDKTKISAPSSLTSRSGDSFTTTQIRAKILGNPIANKPDIEIITEDGEVFLMGIVTKKEKQHILHIVKTTSGVQKIIAIFEVVDL